MPTIVNNHGGWTVARSYRTAAIGISRLLRFFLTSTTSIDSSGGMRARRGVLKKGAGLAWYAVREGGREGRATEGGDHVENNYVACFLGINRDETGEAPYHFSTLSFLFCFLLFSDRFPSATCRWGVENAEIH